MMTAAPALSVHPLVILRPGETTWCWCSKHMTQTDHLYTGYSLVCLECKPDKRVVDMVAPCYNKHADGIGKIVDK